MFMAHHGFNQTPDFPGPQFGAFPGCLPYQYCHIIVYLDIHIYPALNKRRYAACIIRRSFPGQTMDYPYLLDYIEILKILVNSDYLVGGLEQFLFFHNIWDNPSQLTFIFFRRVGIPPTSYHILQPSRYQ